MPKEEKGKQKLPEEEDHTQEMRPRKNPKFDPILLEDIIFEILPRLPVKSLLRFKCVCKPWQSLICSHLFISSRSNHSRNSLLIEHVPVLGYLLYLLKSPTDTVAIELPCPDSISEFGIPECDIDVLGSTNAVICFTTPVWNHGLVLWNPATKQARCVSPWYNELSDLPTSSDSDSCGFGYDPIGNEFTVVRIFSNLPGKNIPGRAYGFSTNSGSWRKMKVELLGSWVDGGTCDAIVEGVPCWRGLGKEGEEIREVVICFDIVNDRFLQFLMPDIEKDRCKQLVEYKHSLGPVFAVVDKMLGFWRGGELIVEDEGGVLVMYNVESRRMRRVHIHYPREGYLAVFDYSGTLVSVTGEQMVGGKRERTDAVAQGPLLRRLLRELKGHSSSAK